jgi:hypothetical protein
MFGGLCHPKPPDYIKHKRLPSNQLATERQNATNGDLGRVFRSYKKSERKRISMP